MGGRQIPLDVVALIVHDYLQDVSLAAGLQLRLVSRGFNQEVLYAFYSLQAPGFSNRWPHGHVIPFDSLAMVRYLHGLANRSKPTRKSDDKHGYWLSTIAYGAEVLRQLLPNPDSVTLLHERGAIVEDRGDVEWVYRRVMCEAIISFLGPADCFTSVLYDEMSTRMGSPFLCILNRPVNFWIVVAACHVGSCLAVARAIVTLKETYPKELDWRVHLHGCMFVAARSGHVDVVRLLIDMGLDANGRAYRGFDRFVGGDGTALCGAANFGCLDTVELILKQRVMGERLAYEWAMYECVKGKDKGEVRARILKRLLEAGEKGIDDLPSVHTKLLSRASRLKNTQMTKVISEYVASRAETNIPR